MVIYSLHYSATLRAPTDSTIVRLLGYSVNTFVIGFFRRMIMYLGWVDWVMDRELQITIRNNFPSSTPKPGVLFYGDSEFTTWSNLSTDLSDCCSSHYEYINSGFGGCRVPDLLRNWDLVRSSVDRLNIKMVIIHVGGNDWDFCGDTSKDINSLVDNVSSLTEILVEKIKLSLPGVKIVFWNSPRRPIYCDDKWLYLCLLRDKLQHYRCISETDTARQYDIYRVDKVHLNSIGHRNKAISTSTQLLEELEKID